MDVIYVGTLAPQVVTGGERRIHAVLEHFHRAGVEIRTVKSPGRLGALCRRNFLASNLWHIYWLRHLGVERAVILQDYSQRFYLFGFNRWAKAFFPHQLVGLVNAFYFNYRNSALKNRVDTWVSRLYFAPLDLVIAGGKAATSGIERFGVPSYKLKVVYPALRREFLDALQRLEHRKNPTRGASWEKNILVVGRLHPVKGLEYLLDALCLLDDRTVRLTIVGDTQRNPRYTQQLFAQVEALELSEQVTFVGTITDVNDLLRFYHRADVFVLPSVWETSPHALLEAMCVGLPIIASRAGGIPEYIHDGETGVLVPPADPAALAQALASLLRDAAVRARFAQRAKEASYPLRARTWDDVGREYLEMIQELWGERLTPAR